MDAALDRQLDKDWRATCRVVLGREVGGLAQYLPWLGEYLPARARRKSHVSGKEVTLASDAYSKSARFASVEEIALNRGYKLGINQVKDLDGVLGALAENAEYCGNRLLGNCSSIEASDLVMNSHFVRNSTNVEDSTRVESSFMVRMGSKYAFAGGWGGGAEFMIRSVGFFNLKRVLEAHFCTHSSDMYFSFYCVGSHDLMFCFGQRNKSRAIGNLALPKDKYSELKKKLVSEIAERLERDRRLPSVFELAPPEPPKPLPKIAVPEAKAAGSFGTVEKGFSDAYSVLFKRKPKHGIAALAPWLESRCVRVREAPTIFGGKTYKPENFALFSKLPEKRMVGQDEAVELGKISLGEEEVSGLERLLSSVGKIAFFTPEFYDGECANNFETPIRFNSVNTYRGYDYTYAEHAACCSMAMNSKYVYGCGRAVESEFCMKCDNGLGLKRCFECDSCQKCSDCYFCHNCEGLTDCMFCFNMKGARNCIGNTQLSREEYVKAKDVLLAKMADELDAARGLKMSIYNVGAPHGSDAK